MGLLGRLKKALFEKKEQPPLPYNYTVWNRIFSATDAVCVDIGGANSLPAHWQKIAFNAKFIVYEPDLRSYEQLVKRQKTQKPSFDNYIYINDALSKEVGERDFNLYNAPTGSTFYEFKDREDINTELNQKHNEYIYPLKKIKLTTASLKSSLDKMNLNRIDMIKIDVQGAELEILQGLDDPRWNTLLCVEAEVSFQDVYENAATFETIKAEMLKRGFKLFDLHIARYHTLSSKENQRILEQYFQTKNNIASLAGKVWEADHVYMRDKYWAMKNFSSIAELKRLVIAYCVYNYFVDAIVLCEAWRNKFPESENQIAELIQIIIDIHSEEKKTVKKFNDYLASNHYLTWGQYEWMPYPCS